MREGQFFENYFSVERGEFYNPNTENEVMVCCPFPHDKGYETTPSACVNVEKHVFICFTCRSEGREFTFSEVGFAAKILNVRYYEAREMLNRIDSIAGHQLKSWDKTVEMLQSNAAHLAYLNSRGITPAFAKESRLGFAGGGILYPIIVFDTLIDVREYNPNEKPKMRSKAGAHVSLFPFDTWRADKRPTFLCAGENDALLLRSKGYNALTTTGGEGQFPKMYVSYFKDRDVYIVYDCDLAGRKGVRNVAHILREGGVKPKIIDLALAGTPDDKDVTDFFTKRLLTVDDFNQRVAEAKEYTDDMFTEDKNRVYPLINLWHVGNGAYENRRLSSRVQYSGKYDMDMRIPDMVEWSCEQSLSEDHLTGACVGCPLYQKDGMWALKDTNLRDALYLVEQDESKVTKTLRERFVGFPTKCPLGRCKVVSRLKVQKATFSPDVSTEEDVDGFQAIEQPAYILGDITMQEGSRYRTYYKSCAHPNEGNRVYMVVDRIEDSDNALNAFRMTPEMNKQLAKSFRKESVEKSMMDRAIRMKGILNQPFLNPHPMITHSLDLSMHSVIAFTFMGSMIDKGYPEIIVVGESRTGKSEAAKGFIRYARIGNITVMKEASRASLLGGSDRLPNGSLKVKWGTIPRNNRGFLTLDEVGGASRETLATLTDLRSSGVAKLEKMGVSGSQAPAKTRLFWLSNPRPADNGKERPISSYPFGIDVIRDLIGKDEDISRFDAMYIVTKADVEQNGWMDDEDYTPHESEDYRNLIHWVWSRKPEQVRWDDGVERYIKKVSDELNKQYDTNVKIFGLEAWKKLARLSIACAGATYSATDDGECILVTKEHVDFVQNYLIKCYINPTFKLDRYVKNYRMYEETNDEVNKLVAKIIGKARPIVAALVESPEGYCSYKQLEYCSNGKDNAALKMLLAEMSEHKLIKMSNNNVIPTQRFHKAVEDYRHNHQNYEMTPLSRDGAGL